MNINAAMGVGFGSPRFGKKISEATKTKLSALTPDQLARKGIVLKQGETLVSKLKTELRANRLLEDLGLKNPPPAAWPGGKTLAFA